MPHDRGRLIHPLGHLEPHMLNGPNNHQYRSLIEISVGISCSCYFCIGLNVKITYLMHESHSIIVSIKVTEFVPYRFLLGSI